MQRLKRIMKYVGMFWFFGGGFFLGLMCLIWSWKICVAVLVIWSCSWIILVLVLCFKAEIIYDLKQKIKKDKDKSTAGQKNE